MTAGVWRVVFDCNVYAQALINSLSPAGLCYHNAQTGRSILFTSAAILDEIAELHRKLPDRYGITADDCQSLLDDIRSFAQYIERPSEEYLHPIDPDDSPYVNLAIAAKAHLIVSRDKHLLGLIDLTKPWSLDFRNRYPAIRVLTPDQYLTENASEFGK